VQPITVVKTDYKQQFLSQIAVNSIYICYGLKQGSIRVLNKNTASRTLLKEHNSMVTDMRFFNMGSNVLASCDLNGEVIVRKVSKDCPCQFDDAHPDSLDNVCVWLGLSKTDQDLHGSLLHQLTLCVSFSWVVFQ